MKPLEQLFNEYSVVVMDKIPEMTYEISMKKLNEELIELHNVINTGIGDDNMPLNERELDEHVDCIMCLIAIASQRGYTSYDLRKGFERKLEILKNSEFVKNDNGTFSRIKHEYKEPQTIEEHVARMNA